MFKQPFGEQLVAGDAWSWLGLDLSRLNDPTGVGYAPPNYTLKYAFRGPASLDLTGAASSSGIGWDVTATPAQTGELPPGTYQWTLALFDASQNRTTIAQGEVDVLADVFAAGTDGAAVDMRSWVRQSLDAVRAVIQGRASRIEQEYTVAGRMLRLLSPQELLDLEGELTERYNKELRKSGQKRGSSNQIHGRFGVAR